MAVLPLEELGLFRANEHASQHNNIRLVDPNTPGTPEQDQGTIDTTGAAGFEGIVYTGKDGVSQTIYFNWEEIPDGRPDNYAVPVADGRAALQAALLAVLEKHEVNTSVTVTGATVNFIVTHIGAGTLEAVLMDGSAEALSRTPLP